ncbi:DUF305 domain-containing protein [Streptomyces dangxiongensis]|uniref:DUF305 domain-containing protein n=1 Tax=Streptomyces dangxiongensis TaxID=1442032 RepID=A0A3G2JQN4_9ACTN|nr:DUF305 domain-containing protein [Streptomyces dangxiongensis]AYN42557.1 DUF305 domain-containing protein [Streptomyces dangxiongensis]
MTRRTQTPRALTRRAAVTVAAATAALLLAACGGNGGTEGAGGSTASAAPSASTTAHNAQDVAFAQGMIPHHRQALEMAELADDRASSTRVKDLAARIEKAQGPEIRTMTGWLTSWGKQVPRTGMDHSGHSAMSGMSGMSSMQGMMDDDDMTALRKATGKEFDSRFLALMVAHHQGAVEMATTERDKGRYGPALTMADAVVTAQTAEIKEMRQLLGTG